MYGAYLNLCSKGGLTIVALLILFSSVVAPAVQRDLDIPLGLDPSVVTGTLPNGLQYFIRQNANPADRIALRLAVKAGSVNESENQRGLAHFLEHMAFNGSTNFKPGELVAYLESIGARFGPHVNAYTSFDETVYMLNVPTDRTGFLDRGFLALSDFAFGLTLDPIEIDRERGVVIEEWRQRRGSGARVQEIHLPLIYADSKYAERNPIGLPEVLKTFQPETLRDFYQRWYRPERMAVIAVGDVDPVEAEQLIKKHFGTVPPSTDGNVQSIYDVPVHEDTRYAVALDSEAQSSSVTLLVKRPFKLMQTVEDYRVLLINSLVHQIINARFSEISQQPEAPFLGASVGASMLGQTTEAFVMTAQVSNGEIPAGLMALAQEVTRIRQHGFGEAELERAKKSTLAMYERLYNERNTSEHAPIAGELVRHFLEAEPVPGITAEFEFAKKFLPDITSRVVAARANEIIGNQVHVVLAAAPEASDSTALTEPALQKALIAGTSTTMSPWSDDIAGQELLTTTLEPGSVIDTRSMPDLGLTILSLSNGVTVWLKPTDFKNDQILFTSYAKGGLSLSSREDYQEARLGTALVGISGIGGFKPIEINKLLSGQLVGASPYITQYVHGISGSSTPRDLETALKLVYLNFTSPNKDSKSFELLRTQLRAVLANQAESPGAVFSERLQEVNTLGHYSSQSLQLSVIPSLRPDTMLDYYRARFSNAADFTFFFTGAFTIEQITPLLIRYIASLPSTGTATSVLSNLHLQFPSEIQRVVVRKGQEPKSQTVISFFADTGLDEMEMHRLRAVSNVLEMRLRDLLREELGGTYGVGVNYSNTQPQPGYGTVSVVFGSSPENVDLLTNAVLEQVEQLRTTGPTNEEIQKIKEIERRDLETASKNNAYWSGSLQTVHILGWDPLSILGRPARTKSLSLENIQAAAKRYLSLDRYTIVTLLPELSSAPSEID